MDEKEMARRLAGLGDSFAGCSSMLAALGDETRQGIVLALLASYGGLRVGEVGQRVGLSRPAASHHLRILKQAGVVRMYKRGTLHYYHMSADEDTWGRLAGLCNAVYDLVHEMGEAGMACPADCE